MSKNGAGQLDERVIFDSPLDGDDDIGGQEVGWLEEFVVAAGYTRLRGGEKGIADRLEGRQPTIIRVRRGEWTNRINTDWRVRDTRNEADPRIQAAFDADGVWSGEIFNVRGRADTSNRQFIDFICESGVAA